MSRRVQVLFLVALLGVLACLGLAVAALAGAVAAAAYSVVVLALLGVGARRARAAQQVSGPVRSDARSCTCCTTSQHDPVKVI